MTFSFRAAVLGAALLVPGIAVAADAVFPPGSRIGLAPPAGMQVSKRFTGFESPKTAVITFAEMPPDTYPQIVASLTAEGLKEQGITLKDRKDVKVGAVDGVLVAGDQAAGTATIHKWVLVAADPTMTAFVMAQTLAGPDGVPDAAIEEALKTVVLRPPLPIEDQVAALPFRVKDRAGFRPVRAMAGNAVLLTDGPDDVIKDADQPVMVIARSVTPGPGAEQRDAFARAALAANPGLKDFYVERSQSYRLKGVDWHEIVARAKQAPSDQEVVVMQTLRFSPGSYLRMFGVTRADQRDAVLPRFRSIVDSVEEKE